MEKCNDYLVKLDFKNTEIQSNQKPKIGTKSKKQTFTAYNKKGEKTNFENTQIMYNHHEQEKTQQTKSSVTVLSLTASTLDVCVPQY